MKLPSPSSSDAVLAITGLSRRFGYTQALEDVSLYIPRGSVFGLVGQNGAGKTTLIKHVLGLLKAESGTVRVFGSDPVGDCVGVLRRVGYLSEQRDLPAWMRVDELLRYTSAFYPRWDTQYAEDLRREFGLAPDTRVRHLSQGQQAKAGLLVALAFRPELLVLDEPSSGLDPIVRRDILEAIIRTVAEDGRTVLFSSHLLDEVERVSDQLAMMHRGRVVMCGPLDQIKVAHRRWVIRFPAPLETPPHLAEALSISGRGREWTVLSQSAKSELALAVDRLGASIIDEQTPSLDEIFVARAGQECAQAQP
ncbi:MAG: ABC transporter ATP-binding protein [Verrucomicrobiota bacterium]